MTRGVDVGALVHELFDSLGSIEVDVIGHAETDPEDLTILFGPIDDNLRDFICLGKLMNVTNNGKASRSGRHMLSAGIAKEEVEDESHE